MDKGDSSNNFVSSSSNPVIALQDFFSNHKISVQSWVNFLLLYSGGVDSTVLLHALLQVYPYPNRVHVLHVDYALRGEESCREAEGIEKICRKKKVIFHQLSCPLSYLKNQSGNLQAKAREFRYREAREIAIHKNIEYILTAHHRDDHLETFLAKLLKGQSPASLAGVIEDGFRDGVQIMHPFSKLAKADLEAYAHEHSIPFYVDSSNSEDHYERNYLRRRIFPLLDSKFSGWRENVIESMGYLTQSHRLLRASQTWIAEIPPVSLSKNKKITIPGFILNPGFDKLSREEREYIFHYGLHQYFPLQRFSRDEIRSILDKIGNEDKKLFTYYSQNSRENSGRQHRDSYEVVCSRGWVAPLITFQTNSKNEGSDFVIEIEVKESIPVWKSRIGFSWPGKIIFTPNPSSTRRSPDSIIPVKFPKNIDLPRLKEWGIRPLSDYQKSERVGKKTIKKYIEGKKLPASVRSSLIALSCNDRLLGAINLWGYEDESFISFT